METDYSQTIKNKMPAYQSDIDNDLHQVSNNVDSSKTNSKDSTWLSTQPKLNSKSKSGYILFSAEVRKRIMNENPEAGFGEVSKIVGIEWKKLSADSKKEYEMRAQFIAEERAKAEVITPLVKPGQIVVYACRWDKCDFHFSTQEGVYEHVRTSHSTNIASQKVLENSMRNDPYEVIDSKEKQFVCHWTSCTKYRKDGKPFPTLPRLHRHVKEKHLHSCAKAINPDQKPLNYFVFYSSEELHQQPEIITSSMITKSETGRFVHYPFGIPPTNPIAYLKATLSSNLYSSQNVSPTSTISNNVGLSNGSNVQYGSSGTLVYGNNNSSNVQYHYGNPSTSTSTPNRLTYNNGMLLNSASTPVGVYLSNGSASGQIINGYPTGGHPVSQHSSTHYLIHQSSLGNSGTSAGHLQYQNQQQQAHLVSSALPTSSAAAIQYVSPNININSHSVANVPPAQTYQIIYQPSQNTPPVPVQQQYVQAVYIPAGAQYQTYVINPNGTVSAAANVMQSPSVSGLAVPSTSAMHQIIVHQQPSTVTAQSYQSNQLQQTAHQNLQTVSSVLAPSIVNGVSSGSSYLNSAPNEYSNSLNSAHSTHGTSHIIGSQHQITQNQQHLHQSSLPSSSSLVQNGAFVSNGNLSNFTTSTVTSVTTSQPMIDTGRTIVQTAPQVLKPVFMAPPNSMQVKRVLHSEVYVQYIESLYNSKNQKTISKWENNLQSNFQNTIPNQKKVPYDWIKNVIMQNEPFSAPNAAKRSKVNCSSKEDQEMIKSLWRLRDQLIESTTGIQRSPTNVNGIAPNGIEL